VHNSNLENIKRGIFERVYFSKDGLGGLGPPLKPRPLAIRRLHLFRTMVLKRLLPPTSPLTDQEFLDCYPARKQKLYQNAIESLKVRPIRRADAYLSTFVKAEKVNFTAKPDPAPRVIQPRSPRFNITVGKYLKPVEKRLYQAIAKLYGSTTVCKGLNAKHRGQLLAKKWRRFTRPLAIGLDASRFDQHCSKPILQYEHGFYNKIWKSRDLQRLLSWQCENVGFCRVDNGELFYTVSGCRMSGDMNTALGNCIVMCALIWTCMKELNVKKFELMNDGDDCVLIVEEHQLPKLRNLVSWFEDFGFRMKREPDIRELEKVEFCQCQPVFDGQGYVMVRNPHIACAKDLISFKTIQSAPDYDFLRGSISECGLSLASGIPVQQAFYQCLGRGVVKPRKAKFRSTGMEFMAKGMSKKVRPIAPETRYSFYVAFDITPDEQVAMEEYYSRISPRFMKPLLVEHHRGEFCCTFR